MPRETLVIELNCQEPIGSDQKGIDRLKRYMHLQAAILNEKPLVEPQTHLSPLYGLSGWVPFHDSAVHLYAWDNEGQEDPPFISVDISRNSPLTTEEKQNSIWLAGDLMRNRKGEIVHKTSDKPNAPTWRELAPNIIRQRLSMSGKQTEIITEESIADYMESLSTRLHMSQLSTPLVHGENAWMHWETSGAIASWDNQKREANIDIYTCKPFTPEDAIAFTRERLRLIDVTERNF